MRRLSQWSAACLSLTLLTTTTVVFSTAASAAQTGDTGVRLAQMMAERGGGKATVLLGAVPTAELTGVPLPHDPIVGSVTSVQSGARRILGMRRQTAVFYRVASGEAAAHAYGGLLAKAGWKVMQLPDMGGFVASASLRQANYCGKNGLSVNVSAPSGDPTALILTVTQSDAHGRFNLCNIASLPNAMTSIVSGMRPLPKLTAPAGAEIQAAFPALNPFSSSAASLKTTASVRQTLTAFVAELAKAGWKAGASAIGTDIATESFSFTDKEHVQWRGVLTVSAAGKGKQIAFLTASRENGE